VDGATSVVVTSGLPSGHGLVLDEVEDALAD
jgi:hypothetical protein